MSERKFSFAYGEFYHIYNRGNSKQVIFRDLYDYQHFLKLLYIANDVDNFKLRDLSGQDTFASVRAEQLVAMGAYCLMPNHFHILMTQRTDNGISKFMQKVATGYSMYFNAKYYRTGGLFEGRFKARHVDSDNYMKYLFSYIHLNPVKLIDRTWKEEGIKNSAEAYDYTSNYKHSSLPDYLGNVRAEMAILNTELFPEYYASHNNIKKELFEWLTYSDEITLTNTQVRPMQKGWLKSYAQVYAQH